MAHLMSRIYDAYSTLLASNQDRRYVASSQREYLLHSAKTQSVAHKNTCIVKSSTPVGLQDLGHQLPAMLAWGLLNGSRHVEASVVQIQCCRKWRADDRGGDGPMCRRSSALGTLDAKPHRR